MTGTARKVPTQYKAECFIYKAGLISAVMPRFPLKKERFIPLVAGEENLQFLTLFEDCLS